MSGRRIKAVDVGASPEGETIVHAPSDRAGIVLYAAHCSTLSPAARVRFTAGKGGPLLFELGAFESRRFGRRGISIAEHGPSIHAQPLEGLAGVPIVVDVVFSLEPESD